MQRRRVRVKLILTQKSTACLLAEPKAGETSVTSAEVDPKINTHAELTRAEPKEPEASCATPKWPRKITSAVRIMTESKEFIIEEAINSVNSQQSFFTLLRSCIFGSSDDESCSDEEEEEALTMTTSS